VIDELIWDSDFFGRKMGELKIESKPLKSIVALLDQARNEKYEYLICRMSSMDTNMSAYLESRGFYLSDIGVTWAANPEAFTKEETGGASLSFNIAKPQDAGILWKMSESLFTDSRFYSDPFFSKEEVDRFFLKWIENSILGTAADIVFFIDELGFITCRRSGERSGQIKLIGVSRYAQRRGVGRALVARAMQWFAQQRIIDVTVRTQLKNVQAMNFYRKLGFYLDGYDLVFAKIIKACGLT
jgi:dTDP-4-amino-4,6-dideoxy-D-galactose acyltransferase